MTQDEQRREARLKRLTHDMKEVQQSAEVVAARAILGEVRFVESLFERRRAPRKDREQWSF